MTDTSGPPAEAQAPAALPDGASVLVVDDKEDNRLVLRRRLARQGYAVAEAVDGPDALARIARNRPDIVLLDHMMPGMSGHEVLERIRADFSASELPVIMVTAHDDERLLIDCLNAGANDFVSKPVSFKVLRARMKTHLALRAATMALRTLNDRLECRVAERTAEISRQAEALRGALAAAQAGNRAKSRFLSSMSHDLRTPLNAVIGLSDILRQMPEEKRAAEGSRLLDEVHRNGLYLLSIVSDVLEMSAVEAGQAAAAELAPTDLSRLLDEAIAMARDANPAGPPLALVVDTPCTAVPADAALVRRAVDNLITNAQKYAGSSARILVRLTALDGAPVVEVADGGPGLPESMLDSICEPFFTLGARDGSGQRGTGLGLAIVADIMKRHNGSVTLANGAAGGLVASLNFAPPSTDPPMAEAAGAAG